MKAFLFAIFFRSVCSLSSDISERIGMLENIVHAQVGEIMRLNNEVKIQKQENEIILKKMETLVAEMRNENKNLRNHLSVTENRITEPFSYEDINRVSNGTNYTDLQRGSRLLIHEVAETPDKELVAFYAYMSHFEVNPSEHHTLIFETVKTNIGNGYNSYSGLFTVPSDGVYVFSYTISMGCHSAGSFEIMKNSEIIGSVFPDAVHECLRFFSSETVVTSAVKGDTFFIRTGSTTHPQGNLHSDEKGRTSFTGFKLSA